MLPVPTLDYLALFTGREASSYSPFAEQALTQATLMFATVTKLQDWPDDADLTQVGVNGILQMADRLYLEQPFAPSKASPFSSETIGSYSYSKQAPTLTQSRALNGELTGLFWWDLAVRELSQEPSTLVESGSIAVIDRGISHLAATGEPVIVGPADLVLPELLPPGNAVEVVPADAPAEQGP